MKSHLFLTTFIIFQIVFIIFIRHINIPAPSLVYMGLEPSQEEELNSIYSSLILSFKKSLPPSISTLEKFKNILNKITTNKKDVTKALHHSNVTSTSDVLTVCPEEFYSWINKSSSKKGFRIKKCNNVLPISKVLSVVINFDSIFECSMNLQNILSGLNEFYPSVFVYIPSHFIQCTEVVTNQQIVSVPMNEKWSSGKIWNKLINAVSTPYVLLGRDLDYFDNFSQIERQIRVISYIPEIKIAGGSQRNLTGHWKVGCYQIHLSNYVLEYLEGYYVSRNECMFCDHLLGSFVSTKAFLRRYPFDENLPEALIFEDFFIRLKQDHNLVVNCPDAMYFSTNSQEQTKSDNRTIWLPLVRKLELNRIFLPDGIKHSYSCSELNFNCGNRMFQDTKWYLLPLCCIEKLSHLVQVFHNICEENNITYIIRDGTLLGAVKMNGVLPWDIDGDISIFSKDYKFYIDSKKKFNENGLQLDGCSPPGNGHTGNCQLFIDGMFFDLWGIVAPSQDLNLPEIFKHIPTKQRFLNTWMYTETSPGYYARKRFGREILKHSNSWRHLKISPYAQYDITAFEKCVEPKHHACEDKFANDGNLQFLMP